MSLIKAIWLIDLPTYLAYISREKSYLNKLLNKLNNKFVTGDDNIAIHYDRSFSRNLSRQTKLFILI